VKRSASVPTIHRGPDDPTLTGHAGLLLVRDLNSKLHLVERLDAVIDGVRRFKCRRRGLSGGQLLVCLAESMLAGGSHLAHLDSLREDEAGRVLRAVAEVPAPETASQLLPRFVVRQLQAVVAELARAGVELDRMLGLGQNDPVTLDLDSTTTEVHGRQKQDATYNYEGKRSLGSLFCTWAERRRVVAAQLRSGSASDKPISPAVVQRALRTLPQGHGEVRLRADSGFYSVPFLTWCRKHRLRFCVVVPHYRTMWEARRHIAPNSWRPAQEMAGAEVAEMPFVPTGWEGAPLRLLVRRVRVEADEISHSPRSRRRRTIPKQQLRLALKGAVSHTYSYSFIVTDLEGDAVELEHWQRRRAHIEERIKDLKLGCGLLHLPLRQRRANHAWQTAAVIASNLTAMLSAVNVAQERQAAQAAAGGTLSAEELVEVGQPHNTALLRRWLLAVPARLVRKSRQLRLRLAPGMVHKREFWALHHHILALAPTG
jgi:hypothetical protein